MEVQQIVDEKTEPTANQSKWQELTSKIPLLQRWRTKFNKLKVESDIKLSTLNQSEMSGWQRLKLLYLSDENVLELSLPWTAVKGGFLGGFFIGGILGQKRAVERYESYSMGKSFGNRRNAMRRKFDYLTLMFARNGVVGGIRLACLTAAIMYGVTHMTVYRNRYSFWYFPALSAFATSVFILPMAGVRAVGTGVVMSIIPSLLFTGCSCAYAGWNGWTLDETYWRLRREYNTQLRDSVTHRQRVNELMSRENLWFRVQAEMLLQEMERKKEDGKNPAVEPPEYPNPANNKRMTLDELFEEDRSWRAKEREKEVSVGEDEVDGTPVSD